MRRLLIEATLIFVIVLRFFSIDRYRSAYIFENNRNNELKFYLLNVVNFNRGRIVGVENYIKSLNNVIKLISSEYKEMKD